MRHVQTHWCKSQTTIVGQLPRARLNPGDVFKDTGVDYAGPLYIKSRSILKPVFMKCYVTVFVSLSLKAVHLEPVTEVTTSAFIATLCRFVAQIGLPTTIRSCNGMNFAGAAIEIRKLVQDQELSDHCSSQGIQWKLMPEHSPILAVMGESRFTYKELTTLACTSRSMS